MKHIVCHSGGESSALVAVEVVRKFGPENVVLLNHDMHFSVEDADIKRFKREIADYLELPLTFANRRNATQDQFDVCVESKAFKVGSGSELCTSRLKTEPFFDWLAENADSDNTVIYYGYDDTAKERVRMQRRIGVLGSMGWSTDYPLVTWQDRTIHAVSEIGIAKPRTYDTFIHGNCIGCLKAGWQHWYIVYCTRPDIWLKGKWAEEEIGYAIHYDNGRPIYLEDMEPRFGAMKAAGVPATENIPQQRFWAQARKIVPINDIQQRMNLPCDCHQT